MSTILRKQNGTDTSVKPSSTQQIKAAAQNTIQANQVLQLYVNVITSTPNIDLSSVTFQPQDQHVVADLATHQTLARTHATSFFDGPTSINAQMVSVLSDIIGFNNTFQSRYQTFLSLAGTDGSSIQQNQQQITDGINGLINQVDLKINNCKNILTLIPAFQINIQTDSANLSGDNTIISATLQGENGQIQEIQSNIAAIHTAIDKDNWMIAGGAVMEAGGILMAVVGVGAESLTFGTSTALVVGGLALVGGGIAMQVVAGKDIANKLAKLQSDTDTLQEDETVAATLTLATNNINSMVTAISNANSALTNLQGSWASLKGDLKNIVTQLQTAEDDNGQWFIDDMNAAQADWNDASTLAQQLQSNGTLPVQSTNGPIAYPAPNGN